MKQALDSYNNKKAAVFALDNEASKLELKLKQARAQEREVKKGLDSNGVNLELEVEQLTQKMNAINSQVDSEQSMAFNSQQKLEILEQQLQTCKYSKALYAFFFFVVPFGDLYKIEWATLWALRKLANL